MIILLTCWFVYGFLNTFAQKLKKQFYIFINL